MIKIKSILIASLLSMLMFGATSCDDNFIYEQGEDCVPRIRFVFKKHRQALHSVPGREPDAFYSMVGSVHIFVYDVETGELVLEKFENSSNLQSESDLRLGSGQEPCFMPLDIPDGTYRIVAWCGLDETDENNAFFLNENSRGAGYAECSVKYNNSGHPVNSEKYESLYHGLVKSVEISVSAEKGMQIIPVELTKNTNDIAVWVQHTSKTFEDGEYEVVYTDANGSMHFENNTMNNSNPLEYHAHTTSVLSTSTEFNSSTVETGALVAHISTARLMEGARNDARLEVRSKEGDVVFSIPFVKYVLQMQTLTNDHQYYLDCEDTYKCSFYLTGENDQWMPSRIIINNWVVVPPQKDEL